MNEQIATLHRAAQAMLDTGNLSGAAQLYRDILMLHPMEVNALAMLALIAQRMGRPELALEFTETALRFAPERAALWANYAVLQRQLERGDPVAAAEEALRRGPELPEALDIAGYLAREAGDTERAVTLHHKAVTLAPHNARMQANYALALLATHDVESALSVAQEALRLDPQMAFGYMVMGQTLRAAADPAAAAPCFEQAVILQPDYHDAAMQAAQSYLVMGQWDQGWPWWEKRRYDAARFAAIPRWQGERVGHLLVHAEQGFGDIIHCLRFMPMLAGHADKVTLQIPPALRRLVEGCLPDIELMAPDDAVPQADAHVPMMSLFHLLHIKPDEASPPLAMVADATDCAVWRDRLAPLRVPRIGFIPAGNPKHANDRNRSLTDEEAQKFIEKFSEQVSVLRRDGEIALPDGSTAKPRDFMATAAWMAALDIIVTVDTAAVHLAGSLGKRTFLLLPYDAEWRWFYERTDTIWYPSVHLFRQKTPGDWAGVMAQVSAVLPVSTGMS